MATRTPEAIKVGEVTIRFLVEGGQSAGSVAVFEFDVPGGARVPIAHSHDGYEETIYGLDGVLTWTVEGTPTEVGPARRSLSHAASSTASTTPAIPTLKRWRSSPPAVSAPTTFARQRQSSPRLAVGRPTSQRSQRQWVATA